MPKEYTLIGGNGTVVSPLEVTEDGDYVAGDSRAFNPVKVRTGSSGSSTLSGLTDVDISNPSDGQTLVYNATSGKWENGGVGGGLVIRITEDSDARVLNKTFSEIWGAFTSGQACVVVDDRDPDDPFAYPILSMSLSDLEVSIAQYTFYASSVDDYPMNNDK